jgi:phage tail sheath protein FI
VAQHGVYVYEKATSVGVPAVAESGIPFVIGAAPIQSAANPAKIGDPVLCTSFEEAEAKLGYSENWKDYNLCEFMFSHFKLYGSQPVIFVNLLNPAKMNEAVAAADKDVVNHKIAIPIEAINDETLVVKPAGGSGNAYVKDTDYAVYYEGEYCYIELLPDGAAYSAESLNVAYKKVTPGSVNAAAVATGMEAIERCLGGLGVVPDLICAPGYSHDTTVAAVMAGKAAGINGMFKAKALIDLSTKKGDGATDYSEVNSVKNAKNITDVNQIACWPMLKLGDRVFHMSTQLAGLMASVDTGNAGCPYESPSNKRLQADSMVLDSEEEVDLTHAQANILNAAGVVTGLNFMGGLVAWGNYNACYPANSDVKDFMIPISRMFGWVGKTLIKTFWGKLDKPMNRRLIDTVIDTCNIWLNGLVGNEYVLGARAEFRESENPLTDLMAGIIRIHIYITPPSPAQEIDFLLEYDVEYLTSALQG